MDFWIGQSGYRAMAVRAVIALLLTMLAAPVLAQSGPNGGVSGPSTSGGGSVIGPGSTANGDIVTWGNATGTLLSSLSIGAAGQVVNSIAAHTATSTPTPTLGIPGATAGTIALANVSTANTLTLQSASIATSSRTLTLPDPGGNDSVAYLAANQALTNKSVNGLTITSTTGTLTIASGKTVVVNNGLTFAAGADGTTQTFPSSSATIAALNIADQTLSGGANVTSQSLSAGNVTVDAGLRSLQYIANTGAFTITAPGNDGSMILQIENGLNAGAVTFSGFSEGSNTGDALDTTNGHIFQVYISRIHGLSHYLISALQ